MRTFALLFLAAFFAFTSSALALQTETLEQNGPTNNRTDVVILGDGYTSAQQSRFKADAQALIAYVYSRTPFAEYRRHYNFHLVYVVSSESGADKPSDGIFRNTALDATYEAYGIRRLLTVDNAKAFSAAMSAPAADVLFVLVNDNEYGGSGGSQVAVTSVNESSPEILTHEVGHILADLADEYEDAYPGYPAGCEEANVACTTDREDIKWAPWIEASTPLPTPEQNAYQSVVGAFEGARYLSSGIYRPMLNCRMRQLQYSFCPICAEHLIEESYLKVNPTDAESAALNLEAGETVTLDAKPVQTSNDTVLVSWRVDGTLRGTGAVYTLDTATLTPGETHSVTATLVDESDLILLDHVREVAQAEIAWQVRVSDTPTVDGDWDAESEWPETQELDGSDGDSPAEEDGDTAVEADRDSDSSFPDGDLETDEEESLIDEVIDRAVDAAGCASTSAASAWLFVAIFGALLLRRRSV